jgi:hypothetical protein
MARPAIVFPIESIARYQAFDDCRLWLFRGCRRKSPEIPALWSGKRGGVRVEQDSAGIEPVTFLGSMRPVHAKSVG